MYLKGDYQLIRYRLAERAEHFMKADLLVSQFRTWEEPVDAVTVDVTPEPAEVVKAVQQALGLSHYTIES